MTELETLQEQLTRIRSIIAQVETYGYSEMQVDGKKFTTLDLKTLYDREQYLLGQINSYNQDSGIGVGKTSYVEWGEHEDEYR